LTVSTDDRRSDDPGTDDPGTDGPGTDGPGTDGPGIDGSATDGPGTDDPSVGDDEADQADEYPPDITLDRYLSKRRPAPRMGWMQIISLVAMLGALIMILMYKESCGQHVSQVMGSMAKPVNEGPANKRVRKLPGVPVRLAPAPAAPTSKPAATAPTSKPAPASPTSTPASAPGAAAKPAQPKAK
jgi:hypothetical protein